MDSYKINNIMDTLSISSDKVYKNTNCDKIIKKRRISRGRIRRRKDTYAKKSKYIPFTHEIMIDNVNKYRSLIGLPAYID
jgi:hypothetical protein